jgi:hypothetical protein
VTAVIEFLVLLVILLAAVVGGACLVLPAATQAMERVRLEREAAEASWRIHQEATAAFSRMLDAARETATDPEDLP